MLTLIISGLFSIGLIIGMLILIVIGLKELLSQLSFFKYDVKKRIVFLKNKREITKEVKQQLFLKHGFDEINDKDINKEIKDSA